MKFLVVFICLFWNPGNISGRGIYYEGDEISYDDIMKLNASCYPNDSCMEKRDIDSPGIVGLYSCSCDRQCSKFGTCCIDSPYRDNSPPMLECTRVEGSSSSSGYYMAHSCPTNAESNSILKSLCEEEWNGEDDIIKLAPVTSLDTSTTYKNYYCFRCQETTDNFLFWNLYFESTYNDSEQRLKNSDFSVAYNQANKAWEAKQVNGTITMPVTIIFLTPNDIQQSIILCDLGMVSDCPETWSDKYTRDRCIAYTAVKYLRNDGFRVYKNAHCALCNSESFDNIACERIVFTGSGETGTFSFAHLLDVNLSDGDKVGKIEKCENGYVWDPYGKKCNKLVCALPGHIIKDGRCTPT